ncbi:hypothetical protein [Lutispora thermophila]|uniref:Uncharacterized protein n=1 Tax=Lutispora thermophila DSM 19022 TaxID=1122184 RepID=A0A1M6J4Y0_9FIRM|nr:hypothetical protein [Lutispora thermophila]SHJ41758.1 hypothetical protein SAMN02745176_03509 [Lutispora thermophila DSM 19022]
MHNSMKRLVKAKMTAEEIYLIHETFMRDIIRTEGRLHIDQSDKERIAMQKELMNRLLREAFIQKGKEAEL